jgi:uncharacterized membrane protein HdeD (DUF308 family)
LGFYLLFVGVLELVRVFVDRSQPWIWSLLIGILGIVAGIVVLNHPARHSAADRGRGADRLCLPRQGLNA